MFLRMLSALAAVLSLSSCELLEKKDKVSISFHAMASDSDPKKTMFPVEMEGRQLLFKLVPEVSHDNITALHPFPAEDGKSNGCTFKLDFRGTGSLEIVTRNPPGPYLLSMVDGKPVDYLTLDKIISDGIITIWQGITDEQIKKLEKKIPHMRGNAGPSMSAEMEMAPVFKKERAEAYKKAKEQELKEKADAKSGKKKEPMKMPELPQAAPSPKIPVEGAATPAPGVPPLGDLPLPKP